MTNHPSADEVYEKVAEICPNISRATVYRDLNRFAENGDILRVQVANAPDRYDLTTCSHAHCLCSVCGKVSDYNLRVLPELDEAGNDGFEAEGLCIIVNGICGACRKERASGVHTDGSTCHDYRTEKEKNGNNE